MGVLVGAVVILFVFNFTVYCEILTECNGFESKTFVADTNDCESYIYCDDEESFISKCPTNQRFNAKLGICDDAENVECLSEGPSTPSKTTLKTSTIKSTSTENKPTTREKVSSTEPSTSNSETSTKTSSSSTKSNPTQPSSSTTSIDISSTTSSNNPIICPTPSDPEEIIYLPSSQSCSEYFMCFSKRPIPMTCPKDLEFNAITGSCDWASSANCKIVGTTTTSPRELCTGNNSGYFEYSNNCHYYYRCMNGMLTIQECPSGFGWDAERKMCSSKACKKEI